MTFLDRLERHLGRFAIPGLTRCVVAFNALIYCLLIVNPDYAGWLVLSPPKVLQGEIWRLVTWIFIPQTATPLLTLLYLYSIWWMGDALEESWGSFRLNLYYILGMIGCTITAFLFGASFGNLLLNFSLLLAIATIAPDLEILMMMIFPLKMKWVAFISLVYPWGLLFVTGGIGTQLTIVVCLLNYFIFFGPAFVRGLREQRATSIRRAKFDAAKDTSPYLHKCEVCGITELTNPDADFRVATDDREYCTAHLPK